MTLQSRTGAAAVAAIAFAVAGISVIGHKIPDQHWGTRGAVLDIAFAVGMIAAAIALPALAGRLGVRSLGNVGTRLAQAGQVAMAVESVVSTIHDGNTLGPVFMLGLLASFAGLLLLAADGFRVRVARTLAPVPLVGLLIGIAAGNQGGAVVLGIAWAALALAFTRYDVARYPSAANA